MAVEEGHLFQGTRAIPIVPGARVHLDGWLPDADTHADADTHPNPYTGAVIEQRLRECPYVRGMSASSAYVPEDEPCPRPSR